MAWSSPHCSPRQNLYDNKDKLASWTPTEGSNCRTPAPTTTRAPISAVASVVAPLVASGFTDSSMVRYLEDDLQRIVKTILEARLLLALPLAPIPASVIAAALQYEGPGKRPLKARFVDIYQSKTHLECYNFFWQCKDHFVTANATGPNRVPFAATFLKDIILFYWQQHQRKTKA